MARSITKEELLDMLDKYKIGKKPLACLLGWGVTTVMLYLQEDEIPRNEYTCHLLRLYQNPHDFRELLLENGDRLTPVALRKSLSAVESILPDSDIIRCTDYIASVLGIHGKPSLLHLETVLFWSQVFSITMYSEPLFSEDFQPGKSGLPFRTVEDIFIRYGTWPDTGKSCDYNNPKTVELIDTVCSVFNWYGPEAMNVLMKAERNRLCGAPGARKRRTVSKEILRKCYSEVFAQAKVHKLKDIDNYLQKRINFVKKNPPIA